MIKTPLCLSDAARENVGHQLTAVEDLFPAGLTMRDQSRELDPVGF